MRHSSFYVIALILFLTACKLGQPYERADYVNSLSENYRFSDNRDSIRVDVFWWEMFKDTVLQDLIRKGIDNNQDLNIAALRIVEAELQFNIVRADLSPVINYGVGGGYDYQSSNGGIGSASGSITASYQIDLWGRLRNLRDASYSEYLATQEGYKSLMITLISQIADSYLLLRDIDNRLLIAESTLKSWQENYDIIVSRNRAGLVSDVNVKQAIIQTEEAVSSIEAFKRLRGLTENTIAILIGDPPLTIARGIPLQDQDFSTEIPIGLPSELLSRRPDLMAAERRLEAQTARIGAAEALQYPQLTLSADMGGSFVNPAFFFAGLGGQLFGPLFNMKANKRRFEIEKVRTEQLLLDYEATYIAAISEVENALISMETYQLELESRIRQTVAAQEALDLSWVRYENGVTSYLEILDLQRSQFSALLKASETMQLRLNAYVDLYRALGGGWRSEVDSPQIEARIELKN